MPVLEGWFPGFINGELCILGRIFKNTNETVIEEFQDGQRVGTTPIRRASKDLSFVITDSGTKYDLGEVDKQYVTEEGLEKLRKLTDLVPPTSRS